MIIIRTTHFLVITKESKFLDMITKIIAILVMEILVVNNCGTVDNNLYISLVTLNITKKNSEQLCVPFVICYECLCTLKPADKLQDSRGVSR